MACTRVHLTALVAALAAGSLVGAAGQPRFFDDDPIWVEPITQDVVNATRYEPHLTYQTLEELYGNQGDPVTGRRALNVNTVDEVPDGPFYVNRAGRMPLTPDIVARAANVDHGPAEGRWDVIAAKSDGVTPGFTVRDRAGTVWFLKFDPPGWPGMATGSELVAAKLFWAVGYHTVEYHIVSLDPGRLDVAPGAMIEPPNQAARPMTRADLRWVLARSDRQADGSYRVIASRAAPGRPVGRIRFHGTRRDDPNDIVPHEHRRELRGYFVFASWLDHVDAKGINSLAALVSEGGRTFIRRYLLDFGSALGSAGIGPREGWQGFEHLVEDPGEIGRRVLSLGLRIPRWRTMPVFEAPSVGRLPIDLAEWDPEAWRPHISNAAFRHARADDKFWAARKLSAITDAIVDRVVAEGRFGDEHAEAVLARVIRERRDRILNRYLPAINPVVDPVLDGRGLRFANAAVEAGVAAPAGGYRAVWSRFDNTTHETTPLGTTEGPGTLLPAPDLPASGYITVALSAIDPPVATWETPVAIYFRRMDDAWSLVGFERLADGQDVNTGVGSGR